MMRRLFPMSLLVLLSCHSPASAQPTWTCGSGMVKSIEVIDEAITRETISTQRVDSRVEAFVARTDTQHRRSYVVAVQLGDSVYTSESAGDPHATLDPLRIVAGEPIEMCVSATQMIVEGPDGTDYRAPVVRQGAAPERVLPGCRESSKSSSSGCR